MNDFTPNTTANGAEWDVNPAGGTREIELDYEYCVGPSSYNTMTGHLFLNREDLVAMLAALDEAAEAKIKRLEAEIEGLYEDAAGADI